MKKPRVIHGGSLLMVVLVAYGVSGCGESQMAKAAGEDCLTTYEGYTSPAVGVVTFTGKFYDNESVLLRDASTHALVASGTPATDRSSFTFTGIPSGTHDYEVVISCENATAGQVTDFSGSMTIE
ncbi:MAG TPA: hypothetical protein VGM77_07025 [Gemmatimonadales bacterium]|jgi:hypothetical protein